MSGIINGAFKEALERLRTLNLRSNPFRRDALTGADLDRAFVGRAPEMRRAARQVFDSMGRNLLVKGGYGSGKTTFVRKFLRELEVAQGMKFLAGFASLGPPTPEGLHRAALEALVRAGRDHDGVFGAFCQTTLAQLEAVEVDAALGSPTAAFERGESLARAAGYDRIVIGLDEVDKLDPEALLYVLRSSRALLDRDVSFVVTGRPLDAFSDARSALLAAVDQQIELGPFTGPELDELRLALLATAAIEGTEAIDPFDSEVRARMARDSHGLPRHYNMMAQLGLDRVLETDHRVDGRLSVGLNELTDGLRAAGNLVWQERSHEARRLLVELQASHGSATGLELSEALGRTPRATLDALSALVGDDVVVPTRGDGRQTWSLGGPAKVALRATEEERRQLRELWARAEQGGTPKEKGDRLEAFAEALLQTIFDVARLNVRTDTEELDLVLRPSSATPDTFSRSDFIVVECKNRQKVDQGDVSKLYGKVRLKRQSIGLIVTTGELTADAIGQARQAWQRDETALVDLDGGAIRAFLGDLSITVGQLLEEAYRALVMRERRG